MTTPLYELHQVVYLRESAALGRIEAVRVSGIHFGPDGWMYTVSLSAARPMTQLTFGDHHNLVNGATVYYSESELITELVAFVLAEEQALRTYNVIHARRVALNGD